MKYIVASMHRPTLTFEKLEVLTHNGPGYVAGQHTWHPVTVEFANADEVFEAHRDNFDTFDLDFTTPTERWELFGCRLISRGVYRSNEFVVEYDHARQHIATLEAA